MALDEDFIRVVGSFDEIRWDREWGGRLHIRQPGPAIVVDQLGTWATVLIPQQDWDRDWKETRWILTRWQKSHGAWRLTNSIRVSKRAMYKLVEVSQDLLDTYDKPRWPDADS